MKFLNGYALVIGVGNDLPETVNDASAIYNVLINPAKCAYLEDNVKLLTDKNATKYNIMCAMDWLIEKVKNDAASTVIIYFSGHGGENPDYFLVPNDFDDSNFSNTTISKFDFSEKLNCIRSERLLVLFDTCHAGGMVEIKNKLKNFNFTKRLITTEELEELGKGSGRVFIASCRKNEYSEIIRGQSNSVFTTVLLNSFNGYGSFENDGFIRVLDMALYVGRHVPDKTSNRQNPIIKISNLEDNYAIGVFSGGYKSPIIENTQNHIINYNPISEHDAELLKEYRANLLLIEKRMSEFVISTDVPLQLIKEKEKLQNKIMEIEKKKEIENEVKINESLIKNSADISRDDLWNYLNTIITKLNLWNELYTPVTTTTNHSENLSKQLELPVHLKYENGNVIKIDDALNKYKEFVIVGDPGSGKTTSLLYLNIITAREAFHSVDFKYSKIPVFIKLNLFEGNIYNLIIDSFKKYGLNISINELPDILKKGNYVFFLDGINEIPMKLLNEAFAAFEFIHSEFPNIQCIYTSRAYNYNDDLAIPILHIQNLDEKSIISFIDRYLKHFENDKINGYTLLETLEPKIRKIVSNPLMLYMLLKMYISKNSIPKNRSSLYDEFVLQTLEIETKLGKKERGGKFSPKDKIEILSNIAFDMQNSQIVSTVNSEVIKSIQNFRNSFLDIENILDELFNNKLLEYNGENISFTHQSFQEFFAAKKLLKMYNEDKDISFTFETPGWEEAVIFLSGLLKDSSDLIFKYIIDKNLYLGGEAIISANYVDNKVKICVSYILHEKLSDPLLRTREISNTLINKLSNDIDNQKSVLEIGMNFSENELLTMLHSKDWFEKFTAIIGLTKRNNHSIIKHLINLISNSNEIPAIRWRASNALRQLPREIDDIISLIKMCDTNDERIKWPCIHGLGVSVPHSEIGNFLSIKCVDFISQFLKKTYTNETNKNIRYGTVRVLAEVGGLSVIDFLSDIAKNDKNKEVRERAVAGLGFFKNKLAANALLDLFSDSEWVIRREAIRSYGMIHFEDKKNMEIPTQLLSAIKDNDFRVAETAIYTIGKLNFKGTSEILLPLRNNNNFKIREAATKAVLEL